MREHHTPSGSGGGGGGAGYSVRERNSAAAKAADDQSHTSASSKTSKTSIPAHELKSHAAAVAASVEYIDNARAFLLAGTRELDPAMVIEDRLTQVCAVP